MANGYLLQHRHHMLTLHLPGLDPDLQKFQRLLIATHIRKFVVEIRRDREANVLTRQADEEKGIPDLLGYNLIYLFCLGQVTTQEDLPPCGNKS